MRISPTRTVARFVIPVLALVLAACGDVPTGTDQARVAPTGPRRELYDWPRWGVPGFYFLPGQAPEGYTDAAFDANVQPTIRLCRLTSGTCGSTIATWTRTSGTYSRTISVNTTARSYNLTWPTASTGVSSGQIYRLSVSVGTRQLGHMDVQIVSSTTAGAAVDTSQYRWVVRNNNFAFSFRINQGVVGWVTLPVTSVHLGVMDTQTVAATVYDLRNAVIPGADVGYMIEDLTPGDGPVARLDNGTIVGVRPGAAKLWAWSDDVMLNIPITVVEERHRWSAMATPDDQGNRAIWGTSNSNIYAANHTGVLHFDGTAWSHLEATRWRGMHDVWGSSANDVWAVGDNGLILNYDGTSWRAWHFNGTRLPTAYDLSSWALPAGTGERLVHVGSVPGLGSVVITGDRGTLLLWDGTSWRGYTTGDGIGITSIYGTPGGTVYLTRADGKLQRLSSLYLTTVLTNPSGALYSVWGSGSSDIYAVGAGGRMYRYNGTSWSQVRLPTTATLYAVAGSGSANVFTAGAAGALFHYDGSAWVSENPARAGEQHFGLWVSPEGDAYAAAAGGLIAKR